MRRSRIDTEPLSITTIRARATMTSNLPGFFPRHGDAECRVVEALCPTRAGVLAAVGVNRPGMEVVDLCSGDGWFTLQIAKIARHVVAVDIDPNLLAGGASPSDRSRRDALRLSGRRRLRVRAELVAKPVDFVFMADAFHGVPDWPRLASRCART